MALEATTRLWRDVAKGELLGISTRATDEAHPHVFRAAGAAAERLRMKPPPVYVAPASFPLPAAALGTDDAPYVVLNAQIAERLKDQELIAAIGHELGHIQNGHITYATALHYLQHSAVFFVRWIVQPAVMTLQAWSRRAEITCDRAALLATRELEPTLTSMVKVSLGLEKGADFDARAYVEELPTDPKKGGFGRLGELFRTNPYLPKRIAALRLFADGAFYAAATGGDLASKPSADEIDRKVGEILAVF
jgi:Zn-dependent protease with chaperone function